MQKSDNRPVIVGNICIGQWGSKYMAWVWKHCVWGGGVVFFQYLLWANKQEYVQTESNYHLQTIPISTSVEATLNF